VSESLLGLLRSRPLQLIVLASVALRLAGAATLGNQVVSLPGTADQVSYHALGLRLLDGHGGPFGKDRWPITRAGEPTAHWSRIYTLSLAAVCWLLGKKVLAARSIQAVVVGVDHHRTGPG